MERIVVRLDSAASADAAERAYYRSLTPEERLDILLTLVAQVAEDLDEAEQGLARVYRVVEFERR
ncbi:hypothetical protein L6R52_35940 [Myxococcota bacterium]|nr:hypothetical protein [Myxococcota bacterium]